MTPEEMLSEMRKIRPVVHCIGNDISTADSANLLLAAGARPVMSYAPREAAEISRHSNATVLNCGTPTEEKFHGLIQALSGAKGHAIVIDPVGAGASRWRRENIKKLLQAAMGEKLIVRCNYSEGLALLEQNAGFEGVDSASSSLPAREKLARQLAVKLAATVVISGREDVISDGSATAVVFGGNPLMGLVSGSGCMLGAVTGAFAAAGNSFEAAVAACVFWKKRREKAGEMAATPGALRTALIDSAYLITPAEMEEIKVEYRQK